MNTSDLPPLALIAGPTASGKSALAMALADLTPSVIINADSMQVYRDLRVLTARPSESDEAQHEHALFGYMDGAEACSAASWAGDAKNAVRDAHDRGLLPILVGGTGLYIRTLLDGIAPVPGIDRSIRADVRAMPVADAFAALKEIDPDAATRLAPGDTARVARALEVARSTGQTLSAWQSQKIGGIADSVRLSPLILLPPREWLMARCNARFDRMFADGQDEVAALMRRALDPALPLMRAIGLGEVAAFQKRTLAEGAAREAGELATRRYAKRQYTWFTRQPPPGWPREQEALNNDTALERAIMLRRQCLTE